MTGYHIDLLRLGLEILGFGGVIFGLWSAKNALQTNIALDFFRRYDELSRNYPEASISWGRHARLDALTAEQQKEFRDFARRYANLCSEEFALHRKGRVPGDIWQIWSSEMSARFAQPIWRDAWTSLRDDHSTFRPFQSFIDKACGLPANDTNPDTGVPSRRLAAVQVPQPDRG